MRGLARRLGRLGVIRRLRHILETIATPRVRSDLATHQFMIEHSIQEKESLRAHSEVLSRRVEEMDRHLPRLLNVIASSDGAARMMKRELSEIRERADAEFEELRSLIVDERERNTQQMEDAIGRIVMQMEDAIGRIVIQAEALAELTDAVGMHAGTQRWLIERVEMIRAEMLYELRHGPVMSSEPAHVEIVDPAALEPADGAIRLNLGCGHKSLDGYANVDARKLPGVDVVAPVSELPVEESSLSEIFSAHLLEHFPEEALRRSLLPYWVGLLRPGGTFRAIVPDMRAMADGLVDGSIEFEAFRSVAYGGQEYEGDTHFTGFTAESLGVLLSDAGLVDIQVAATGRPQGDCFELEISAKRPG